MTQAIENLAQGLVRELNRNRELLLEYKKIGRPGMFGAAIIKDKIKRGEIAQGKDDVVEMLRAFSELEKTE